MTLSVFWGEIRWENFFLEKLWSPKFGHAMAHISEIVSINLEKIAPNNEFQMKVT